MKRFRSTFAIASISLSILMLVISARGQIQNPYVEGQLIVKVKSSVQRSQISDVELNLNSTVTQRFASGAELWDIQGVTSAEALQRYQYDLRFEYIEPNYIIQLDETTPNDPRFPEMWGLNNTGQTGGTIDADIDAPEAWDIETGDSVLVGIIDTGIDWTHVDLADHIWTNPGEIPGNGIDDDGNGFIDDVRGWDFANNDNNPMDGNGHGTHVAGTVGAIGNNAIGVVGVNWNAKLMPIKFLSDGGSGSTANAILSVEYATMMGVRLTNNSWGGGGFSSALRAAIQAAGSAGILFVAAAGNTGQDADLFPHFPAGYDLDNIISVANTNHNDLLSGTSTFGLVSVDFGAPGSNILSTFPGNTYGSISGTSMASPHVSGAVSLIWSAAPALGHLEVKDALMQSVDPLPALLGKTVTGGRLNIFTALARLDSIPPSPVTDLAVIGTGSNTATLQWTASGDDGSDGTASRYDIRYSLSSIDDGNFALATVAPATPTPQPVGATETFQVTGLDFNTTYFFALKVLDEQDNASPTSNSPSGTTLGIPEIAFSPPSLSESLLTGGMVVRTVTIQNLAAGTLDFSFPGLDPLPSSPGDIGGVSSAIGPSWLHAVPNSGRILAGGTMDVEMRFDATGLAGGDFTENVIIANNDPTQPTATLPVSLHVTAAPDIASSAVSINFGAHFIGATVTQNLTLSNIGTAVLNVSGVSIDNVEYSVDPTGFVLAPSQTKVLVLTFAPVSVGPIAGTLTVSSDDPDTPALAVALTGVGLIPPEIAVAPGILFENLVFGATSTQPLTIENNGGSDLIFDISERVAGASGVSVSVLSLGTSRDVTSLGVKHAGDGKSGPAYDSGRSGTMERRDPGAAKTTVSTRAAAGGDLRILLLHNGDVAAIRTDLLAFADITVVDTFDGGTGTPTLALLESYSAVIVIVNTPLADPVAVGNVLADYVDGGGGVIITLATFISPWDIRGRFSDEGYSPFSLGSGPVGAANLGSFDPAHPIMAGVTSAFGDLLGVTTLTPGAEWVADWDSGFPLVATQRGKVVGMNVFLAGGGSYGGDITLMLRNAAQWSGGTGACWLTAEPDAGTVPAGGNAIINVTFEATSTSCVIAGTFLDTIVVASNDPLAPEVLIPVIFNVTGAPDISVADSLVDYGTVFVGVTRLDTIQVSNQGTDVLVVTGVSTDHTDYSVATGGFVIGVGGSRDLVVSFSPTSEGTLPATLTIASDDPDTPLFNVVLAGVGLLPPISSVSPDSLSEHLFTGGTAVHPITINNTGGSDLFWTVRASLSATSALQTYTLTAPSFDAVDPDAAEGGTTPENIRTTPITATLEDLTDVRILFDRAHGNGSRSGWTTIIADVTSRGATVVDNFDPITPTLLSDFDVFWTVDLLLPFATSELDALRDWMLAGGSLLLEGDNTSTVGIFNSMLAPLGSGVIFSTTNGSSGTTNFIFPHKTTENVNSIFLSANIAHLSSVTAPAGRLVNDDTNVPNSAYSEVGGGRIVAMADEVFGNSRMGSANNQLFANQVFDWLAGSVRWLTVEPKEGVTPADSIDVLTATFDAANLIGGPYDASIIITSNDPFAQTVTVPAHLQVTGAPDIEVSDTAFNFGTEFIGGSRSDTLHVSNVGTDVLTVGVETSNTDYSADAAAFSLAVGASRDLVVTFAPSVVGPIPATLTLSTNDPDEPSVVVTLSGSGLMPPIVSVAPDSLSDSLFTGLTSAHTLTIDNLGASDLEFTIVSEDAGASLVEIMQELELLYRPGDNGLSQDPADYVAHYEEYAANGTKKGDPSTAGLPQASAETMELYHRVQSSLAGGVTLFFDDMESGAPGWTHYATQSGIDQWGVTTARSHSAVRSWRVTQHNSAGSDALQTPPIDLSLVMDAFLSFQHWYNFDDCSNDPTFEPDGGIVEVTTNGGATWTQILPVGGYPYTLDDICGNPLRFLPAYSHDGGAGNAFIPAVFDLTPYVGGVVSLRFHAGWDCGNCESNEGWYIDDVAVTSEGVGWISVDPAIGTVPPGGSTTIDVTFDATGLLGADYDANILIASNDPITPEARVAAHLHVTGAPDIQLSDTSLGFGPWFVGSVVPDTILITNIGTDTLFVSAITLSNSEFVMDTTDTSGFVLNATESRELVVTYTPTLVGPQAGTLTIHSNDVGDPTVVVTLSGEGLPAPDGEVYPPQVGYRLFTGWTKDRQVVIGNKGDADLEWNVRLELVGVATQVYTLTAPVAAAAPPVSEDMLLPGMIRTDPIGALLDDLTDVKILWDRQHGQSTRAGWSVITADLIARGATVTDNLTPITSVLLAQYDILWLIDDFNSPWTGDELAAVAGWVATGGAVLFESDQSVGSANQLLAAIGAGILYSETNASGGVTSDIHPHEITDNVNMFTVSTSALSHLQTVAPPAGRLVDDISNRAVAAYSRVGSGRIVALSDEFFHNSIIGATDNQLFANQAIDWLAAGVGWLSVEPASGTISPNGITQGSIRFDATGLAGGRYNAKVIFETNDPLDPVIEIPAHLSVAAAPDIALSDTLLAYGAEFIGGVSTATFIVSNLGRDVLTVGLPPPSKPDYSVSPSSLTLNPGEDQEVTVSFAPTQTGPRLGHLNVVSNDKDEALLFVSLRGAGLVPPVISVAPDSLGDSLFTGQTSIQTLTINNSGGNDLTFELVVEQTGSPLAVIARTRLRDGSGGGLPALQDAGLRTITISPPSGTHGNFFDASRFEPQRTVMAQQAGFPKIITVDIGNPENYQILDLLGIPYTLVSPAAFAGVSLTQFDLLYVGWTPGATAAGMQALVDKQAEISAFVSAGGGLVALSEPGNNAQDWQWLPFTIGFQGLGGDNVNITNPGHPVMAGLTDADLSGWGSSFHNVFTGYPSSMEVLAIDGGSAQALVLAGKFGAGRVLLTGLDPDWHFVNIGNPGAGVFLRNALEWAGEGVKWVIADPLTGTVPVGASMDIDIMFNAAGLIAGGYDANILIENNDPLNPNLQVPVHLHVTGAPDIALSETLFDYGTHFVGATIRDTLTVSNSGTDILNVSGVSSDKLDYTVDVTVFALAPGASQDVVVTFSPLGPGSIPATLTIASDDPDEPTVAVTLLGTGVLRPVMAVSPDSLVDSLFTGDVATQVLTIDNSAGGSPLDFSILIRAAAAAAAVSTRGDGVTSNGLGDRLRGVAPALDARQRTITIPRPKDLGLNAFDPSAFQAQRLVPAAPAAAPRIITVNIGKPENYQALDVLGIAYTLVTPAAFATVDLSQYDLLYVGWTPGATSLGMQALVDKKADIDVFLSSGGGVVALSENGSNSQDWQWLPFTIGFSSRNSDYIIIANSGHPVMAGLTSADLSNWGSSAHNVFTSLPGALEVLAIEGFTRQAAIVAGPVGGGRVVLCGLDPDWHLVNRGDPGAAILLRNALEWAGEGVGWVRADPLVGTVAPGASTNIDVTFDASGLLGGDYHAELIIASNDPLAAEVVIPAHMNVTGAPNITVSTRLVTFSPLFIGGSDTRSIVVSNVGTDLLTVTGITSDNADYTVDLTNFNLNPGENRTVVVTFMPSSAGSLPGTLTIASNDIDEGLLAITLQGEGLVPPQIVTQPDSLHEALIAGDSAQQILKIRNPGGSDLIFNILVTTAGDSSGAPVLPPVFGRGGNEGDRSRFDGGLQAGVARDGNVTAVIPAIAPASAPDDVATGTAVVWLVVNPPSGTIPAGDSLNITVTFNASTLLGGSFAATMQFSTNVPTQPIVTVPATLDVTGVPKIGVSTTLIDFGSVFIGFPDIRSMLVKNIGTDILSVSGIVSSDPEFAIAPTTFDVPIGGEQTVNVTYAPTSVGAVAAIMTISSNDASQSTLDVDLIAESLVAPVIVVSDDSLKHVIQPGETRSDTITVSNTGGSDLNWNLNVTVPTGSSPLASGGMGGPAGVTSPGRPLGRAANAGVFNVLWHGDHGLGGIVLWSTIISDITARGASVVENSGPITPALLGGFDILWVGNTTIPFTGAESTAIVDWVLAGGSLLIEADTAPSLPIYEALNTSIGSGIFYLAAAGFGGPTNLIQPHEMTSGVNQITLLGPDAQLILFAPAQRLVDDLFAQSIIAFSEVGSGRVIAMTDNPFHDVMINFDDNRLLANQVFNWMAQLAWLTVTPVTGTVAPGGSVDIILNMDGTILPRGVFEQNLNISSNDPATPMVTVAVQLVVDSTNVVTGFDVDMRVPVEFSLHQNYPNPLNPTTTIAYDLPAAVAARLVIYNVRGERIRELVNEFQPPGRYKIQWDGRNTRGESVASGVYFYRLKAGDFVRTRKMIMLK